VGHQPVNEKPESKIIQTSNSGFFVCIVLPGKALRKEISQFITDLASEDCVDE
jgi:hypothetical protein